MPERRKNKEHWISSTWRPMMGWMYMAVCIFDFMLAPVLWSIIQAIAHGNVQSQWQPLTLQGGGLFHMAMGAVLGLSSYGRTKEKMAGVGALPDFGPGTTYQPPPPLPPDPTPAPTPAPTPEPTPAPTPAPTPEPTPAPTPAPAVVNITENFTDTTIQLSSKGQKIVPQGPHPEK